MVKVGVNGFGRIGRNVVRAALAGKFDIQFVAVNDLADAANLAYLLKYDSVHGTIPNQISHTDTGLTIDGRELRVFSSPDPAEIPWSDFGVEIVIEVADVAALYESARGFAEIVAPLERRPWGARDFRVADPFGFYLRITEPLSG